MNSETFDEYFKFASLIHRNMMSAERRFHKALTALRKLKKECGFVPQIAPRRYRLRRPQLASLLKVSNRPATLPTRNRLRTYR